MKRICSEQNDEYKELVSYQTRKAREKSGLFVVEGYHLVNEAIRSGWAVKTVYGNETLYESDLEAGDVLRRYLAEREGEGIRICLLSDSLFRRLTDTETPQGVLATVFLPGKETDSPKEKGGPVRKQETLNPLWSRILILDRIQDPGNLGTLIRTADAAGFDAILMTRGTADPFAPKTVRAAAGSLFRMHLVFSGTDRETIDAVKGLGWSLLVSTPRDAEICYRVPMKKDIALVVGNEGRGASELFLQEADHRILIPMEGDSESLNAAVAGAILLFESTRQRCEEG